MNSRLPPDHPDSRRSQLLAVEECAMAGRPVPTIDGRDRPARASKGKQRTSFAGFHHLRWGWFLLLFFFMASCSLNQTLTHPEDEKEFFQETARLEKLAREHPEASVRAQAHRQLAFLYVNVKNPQINYYRALREMEAYLSLSPDKSQTADFQNWLAVLREMDHLRSDWIDMGEKNQALQGRIEKLQTNLDKARETNDKMRETMEKLKNLDRQMEEKRRQIQ